MFGLVTYELEDGIAKITMNDGRLNVMSVNMLDAINKAFDRAEADKATVIFRSGKAGIFSAGFDLKVFAANDTAGSLAMVKAGGELALRLLSFPAPIIGVCEGHAFPMGTFLLLACDARIGVPGTYNMGLNEVAIGIAPPSFAIELARSRIHPAWLNRTVTLGEMFTPENAVQAGFIDTIVPNDKLEETVTTLAASLSALHRPSHVTAKLRLRSNTMKAIRAAIDAELTIEAYQKAEPSSVALPG